MPACSSFFFKGPSLPGSVFIWWVNSDICWVSPWDEDWEPGARSTPLHPLYPQPGLAERALSQLSSFIRCPRSFWTGKIKSYAIMIYLTLSVSVKQQSSQTLKK